MLDGLRRTTLFAASIDAARRVLPTPILVWLRSRMVRNLTGTPGEVFSEIHRRNIWGYQETVSGAGSTLQYTERLRQSLPGLLAELGVHTLLDLPCGDLHWMSRIELPIERYIGGDIVPERVDLASEQNDTAAVRIMGIPDCRSLQRPGYRMREASCCAGTCLHPAIFPRK